MTDVYCGSVNEIHIFKGLPLSSPFLILYPWICLKQNYTLQYYSRKQLRSEYQSLEQWNLYLGYSWKSRGTTLEIYGAALKNDCLWH